jgi:hypothetical protein
MLSRSALYTIARKKLQVVFAKLIETPRMRLEANVRPAGEKPFLAAWGRDARASRIAPMRWPTDAATLAGPTACFGRSTKLTVGEKPAAGDEGHRAETTGGSEMPARR